MSCCFRSLWRAALALAALILVDGSVWAQSAGYPYPYSGYSFGSTFYPYWGSAPSSYSGAPMPYQGTGTVLRPLTSSLYSPQMFGANSSLEGRLGVGPSGFSAMPSSFLSDDSILLPGSNYTPRRDNRAHIWLRVAADAEVLFDGEKTKQTGTLRYFFSPPLPPGQKHTYQVRVRWNQDGKPVERKQRIDVSAGGSVRLDLTQAPASQDETR